LEGQKYMGEQNVGNIEGPWKQRRDSWWHQ